MTLLWALLQATASPPAASPLTTLKGVVVDAIRDCPKSPDGEIVVCAHDRGFAEGYRLPKLERPVSPDTAPIKVQVAPGAAQSAGTCSAVGSAGSTGCQLQADDAWGRWARARRAEERK